MEQMISRSRNLPKGTHESIVVGFVKKMGYNLASWWLNQPNWKNISQIGISWSFPQVGMKIKKHLKPPPSIVINGVYWGYNPLTSLLLTSWNIQVGFLFVTFSGVN